MKLFQQIDRINALHKLIAQSRTGTPEQLAKKLHISCSRLYCILDELKLMGAPINYSRHLNTYFYEYHFEIGIEVNFKPLKSSELSVLSGGNYFKFDVINKNSFHSFFCVVDADNLVWLYNK